MNTQHHVHDHDEHICQKRTIKGGQGVDNATGVFEYGCSMPKGHAGPCSYTRLLGRPGVRS